MEWNEMECGKQLSIKAHARIRYGNIVLGSYGCLRKSRKIAMILGPVEVSVK